MRDRSTRETFGEALVRLGRVRRDVVVLDADISRSTGTYMFHEEFPARAFNFGVAEQNMIAAAAGLAATGKVVFASTYAVFASMRACEAVRTFVCYPWLNVKIEASHGGLYVGMDGVTHQGIEDIAIMRSLPGMTVVQPADAVATEKAVFAVADWKGPVYLRLIRNPVPQVYEDGCGFELGKATVLAESGKDAATIFATGVMVSRAARACKQLLDDDGIRVRLVDVHTIKPIDREAVVKAAVETGAIVTAEDHSIVGGLGSTVAEVVVEECPVPVRRIGIRDVFGESGGPDELLDAYGMGVSDIVAAVRGVVRRTQTPARHPKPANP